MIRAVKLRIKETCKNANAPSHVRPFVLQILPHYCMGDRSGVCQHDVEAIDQREAFPKQEMADHCSENISHFRANKVKFCIACIANIVLYIYVSVLQQIL